MKNTLQIEIPKGFEVESFDMKKGVVKFKETPKDVKERIKTIDDVLKDNNITQDKLDDMFEYAPEHLKHQCIAELLAKSLNEGWTPDWDDSGEYKYYPWFKMGSSGFRFHDYDCWHSYSNVGSRLCFKSHDLAEYAGKQFTQLYKQFMIIN